MEKGSTMASDPSSSGALIQLGLVCAVIALLTWITNIFFQRRENLKDAEMEEPAFEEESPARPSAVAKKQKKVPKAGKSGAAKFEHPDVVGTLKGHSGEIVDFSFSNNGKYMVSAADDRSLLMWSTKEFNSDSGRNSIRGKVDLDNPVSIDFAPDSKSIAIGLELTNSIKIMKLVKKEGSTNMIFQDAIEFPQVLDNDVLTCAISPSQTYAMIADKKEMVVVLDLKGAVVGRIETKSGGVINHCVVSPCGRFIAFCGYNPELPIYEVEFSSTNVFKGIKKVMIIKGHTSEVTHFAFSLDAVSLLTASRDKTWRLHSVDVRYRDQEDPRFISRGEIPEMDCEHIRCFLSCNGKLVGVYNETTIKLISAISGEVYASYSGFGANVSIIKCLTDNSSRFVLAAAGKSVFILSNRYQSLATIEWLKCELEKSASPQMKARLQQQLEDEEKKLETVEGCKDE